MASSSTTKSKPLPALVPRGPLEGKPAIPLSRPVWVIGAKKGCHLHLMSSQVSQVHALIVNTGHGLYIRDLASRTHTYINRQPVVEAILKEGDKLQIGSFKFFFTDPTATPNEVMPDAKPAILEIKGETMHLPLSSRVTTIGRRAGCDISLEEEAVSTTHALIIDVAGQHYVRDLNSRTGTYLNGEKIHQEALHFGDVIRVGESEFTYAAAPVEEAEVAELETTGLSDPISVDLTMDEEPATPMSLATDLSEPEVSATATPVTEDEVPAESLTAPEPSAQDSEPLPLDLDLLSESADVAEEEIPAAPVAAPPPVKPSIPTPPPVVSKSPAPAIAKPAAPAAEKPANPPARPAAPVAPPATNDDLLDLSSDLDQPLHLDDADKEDTAFNVAHTEPAEPAPIAPVEIRRGWRSTLDTKSPTPPTPVVPQDEISIDEPSPTAAEPEAASDDVRNLNDLDLSSLAADSTGAAAAEPTPVDKEIAAEPLNAQAPAVDPDDLALEALNTPADEDAALTESAADEQDEVSTGELELSDVDDSANVLDLEQSRPPLATNVDEESTAAENEDVFAGVDIDALALEVLADPESSADAESHDTKPAADVEDVSATSDVTLPDESEGTLDLSLSSDPEDSAAAEAAMPAVAAKAKDAEEPESSLDLSVLSESPSSESLPPAADAEEADTLNLGVLEAPEQVVPELSLEEPAGPKPVSDEIPTLDLDVIDPPADSAESVFELTLDAEQIEVSAASDVTPPAESKPPSPDDLAELATPAISSNPFAVEAPTIRETILGPEAESLDLIAETPTAKVKPLTPKGKGKKGQPVPPADFDALPPPLDAAVRIKPSTRRRGSTPKRGKKGAAVEEPIAATPAEPELKSLSPANPDVEVLDSTEPTPESALNLDAAADTSSPPVAPPADDKLSDSVFGRAVEDLAGSALGELVEPAERSKSPLEQIVSEASTFVAHNGSVAKPDPAAELLKQFESDEAAKSAAEPSELPEASGTDQSEENAEPAVASEDETSDESPVEPALELIDESPLDLSELSPVEAADETAEAEPAAAMDEPAADEQSEPELDLTDESAADLADLLPQAEATEESSDTEPAAESDEPVTSWAGSITPDEVSATATDTIEPLPELDDLESLAEPAATDVESAASSADAIDVEVTESDADTAAIDDGANAIEAGAESKTAAPESPAPQPTNEQAPSAGGFFSLSRDADTFIGGMPLVLPDLAPPPSTFGKVSVKFDESAKGDSHFAPAPPPLMIGNDDESTAPPADEPPAAGDVPPLTDNSAAGTSTARPPEAFHPTPPRPRRPRLADYEKRFADVGEDAAIQEMMRSKAPTKPTAEKPSSSGFDGLAMGAPVREADVFSQMPADDVVFPSESGKAVDPFLVDKQASIDLAARNVSPGRVPPGSEPNLRADDHGDIPMAGRAADPFSMASKPRRSAAGIPTGAAPNFQYTGPNHKRRRIGLPVMLGAMVVFMVAAGLAGWLVTPVSSTLIAKASFTNLSQQLMFDQVKFHREEEAVVNSEVVRSQAIALLRQQDAKIDPGVLADPLAFERMTRELAWPEKTNNLVFQMQSVEPGTDRKRLGVLLAAIYNENKNLIDEANQNKKKFEDAQAGLDALNGQMSALVIKIRVSDTADDSPSASQIADVERQATQLSDVWGQAVAKVKDLEATLDRLKPADADSPATPAPAPGADPAKDPMLLQMQEEKAALQAKIDALKPRTADAADTARKTLDDSLQQFQDQLTVAQSKMTGSPELTAYVAAAQKLQAMTKQLTSDLIDRQRVQNDRLADLKSRLDEQVKTHKDEVYENDATLKALNDKLAIARRSYNGATSEGMDAEAARWQQEMDADNAAIETRKAELGQDPAYTKLNDEIKSVIDGNTKALANDQQLIQSQMNDVTAALQAATPGIAKLPADQKALADALAKRTSDLFSARQAYLAVMNSAKPVEDDDLRKMQADVQTLAAKIDQRTTALQNAAKDQQNQSDMEKATLARKIDDAKSALAIAQKSEVDARTQWLAKQTELNTLRDKQTQAHKDSIAHDEAVEQQKVLKTQIGQAIKNLDSMRSLAVSVVPEAPTADSVTVGEYRDPRWKYATICTMSVVGLFSFLILLGGFHHAPAAPIHRPAIESVDPITKDTEDDSDDALPV